MSEQIDARTVDRPGAARAAGVIRRQVAERLRAAGIEQAELDARVLVAGVAGLEPSALIAHHDTPVEEAALERLEAWIERRLSGEPVARILGVKEFWSQDFALGPEALVPRPETETLVEAALAAKPDREAALQVLDLGVGSGALLAAILLERPHALGVGVDRSRGALAVTRSNLDRLGVGERALLVCSDWAAALGRRFDLVVVNPPYIRTEDLNGLPREVRDHDPRLALDGGTDGLAAYRAVCSDLRRLVMPSGVAVLELGSGQEDAVAAIARNTHMIVDGRAVRDLGGQARALVLRPAPDV